MGEMGTCRLFLTALLESQTYDRQQETGRVALTASPWAAGKEAISRIVTKGLCGMAPVVCFHLCKKWESTDQPVGKPSLEGAKTNRDILEECEPAVAGAPHLEMKPSRSPAKLETETADSPMMSWECLVPAISSSWCQHSAWHRRMKEPSFHG